MYTENKMNLSSCTRREAGDMPLCGCDQNAEPIGYCDDNAYGMKERYCDACGSSFGLQGYPVGMVYAPIQHFDHIFDLDTALYKGTIFEELDLPFVCGKKMKGGCCNG